MNRYCRDGNSHFVAEPFSWHTARLFCFFLFLQIVEKIYYTPTDDETLVHKMYTGHRTVRGPKEITIICILATPTSQ